MKLTALESIDPKAIAKAINRYDFLGKSKAGINDPKKSKKEYPARSGNQLTPLADPEKRKLMGQPDNPHGGGTESRGREPSIHGSSRKTSETPTGIRDTGIHKAQRTTRPTLVDLGEPFERGLSDDIVGDQIDVKPVDKGGFDYKTRVEGPSEDRRKRDGSLGFNRASMGLERHL